MADSGRKSSGTRGGSGGKSPELSTLDFGGAAGDAARALAQCADKMEVRESGDALSTVAEEAAVLYASGQNETAAQVLSEFVATQPAGEGEFIWQMLLDLYKLSGERAKFDECGLSYARSFEKSPPPWDGDDAPASGSRASTPSVAMGVALTEQVGRQLDKVRETALKGGAVRIDLTRLRSADEAGCRLLRDMMTTLRRASATVRLSGTKTLANMLAGQVKAGRRENQHMWLLLLDMLQYTDDIERFEEIAVDYAVTFEESPPSWEPQAMTELVATTSDLNSIAPPPQRGFALEGELLGASAEPVRRLAAFASERSSVEVDCVRLKRIDFVCAGVLFNVLAMLQAQGKLVVLENVNAMVVALLRVMGVDQVAQLQLRQ